MIATLAESEETLADLLHRLGDIPAGRIMLRPAPGTATEADVLRLLDAPRKRLCELIDGVLVEKPMGATEGLLALWLGRMIWNFVDDHDLGLVFGADSPFRLQIGLVRYPDVCFVSWDRIGGDEWPSDPIARIIPELAIEILSQSNTEAEIELKLDHYFEAGVKLVWIIDPATLSASVYTSRRRVKHLDAAGELDGGKLLPGFKLSLAELFSVPKRKKKRTK